MERQFIRITNETFLESTFKGAPRGTYTIVNSFIGDPNKVGREAWFGEPWRPGRNLSRGFRRGFSDGNTYLTVSLFTPDPKTGECRRKKDLFHSLRAVMIDDVGTKVDRRKVLILPSAIIETSPGNYQHFLFIKPDADSRDRLKCEQLIDAMIKSGLTADSTDPGMKGVTRYGRLPVGVNAKAKYVKALGRPFQVRCKLFRPERRYTIGEIVKAFKIDLKQLSSGINQPRKSNAKRPSRAELTQLDAEFRGIVEALQSFGMYKGRQGAGPWHAVKCPWTHLHTDGVDSGAYISEPTAQNNFRGGFKCHHGHCARFNIIQVRRFIMRALAAMAARRAA